ncbi:Fanconi anemia group A protein homolog isoform X1 [Homalodisca vitripennis]|uniref:Fanconi anemia group A protein homolog isoform X1 n=1 Tax=Homalodisca vitripennis TaxID=197043 RepID=UPI001EEC4B90|nr:Fanconi anemia group A protein homolog isoform X1 [Homalodisca vitripennis]
MVQITGEASSLRVVMAVAVSRPSTIYYTYLLEPIKHLVYLWSEDESLCISKTNLIAGLSDQFEKQIWCQDETLRQNCAETVAGLLATLVNLGPHTSRHVYGPAQQLLETVVEKFVDRLFEDSSVPEIPVPFLSKLLGSSVCVQSRLQVFCVSVLRTFVQSVRKGVTVEEAIRDQSELYTTSKSSPVTTEIISKVLSKLPAEDVINELSKIVLEEQFNWRWLLTTVSVFVSSSTQGAETLKATVENWMIQAFSSKDSRLLSAAVLCARQCCTENMQVFGSYATWFGGLQVRPASAFKFLFSFLSEMVPFEPVLCLKIHVNKVPSVPANCHSVVADYTNLAKTRLADLKQTTDYVGLFGEYTTTEQEGREADVAKVVAYFNQTREIMKIVLEASVFRKQFYEKVFLAELLKDYNLRHVEFIKKLYSIGKIPHALYNRWRQQWF